MVGIILVENAEKEAVEILVCSPVNTWSPVFSSWKILCNICFTRIWLSFESYISDSFHQDKGDHSTNFHNTVMS